MQRTSVRNIHLGKYLGVYLDLVLSSFKFKIGLKVTSAASFFSSVASAMGLGLCMSQV